ncbi:uncharacterized protein K489DRAFT_327252 [Dissoconium aciculare CBS 342.82]|uniref:GID complex catalytic subunit 2 n=1 Tax=Dissoconium aciculare CBS 342.82 TaxID=1314786 RepID=A0A6J3LS99_9PEZI|nr:uncharacterized protein K489DRAFT_327252 [Dissoconium aciculare CBS 342.82]KAF1818666.1 hypothetical protein K489DRAFT_327252 [Dissoconium aciculare CBS 342.82]
MDSIQRAHNQQETKSNLSNAIADAQKLIDILQSARDNAAAKPATAALEVAKARRPVEQTFERLDGDLKDVNKGLNGYQKALKDKFRTNALPTAVNDALARQPNLINRAIAMHLLREGNFDIAKTFVREVTQGQGSNKGADALQDDKFSEMYHILFALRNQHNLEPAIEWARKHSAKLESRGSNLEFELSRLKFVELYTSDATMPDQTLAGPLRALEYARKMFPALSTRYSRETSGLLGSLAFYSGLESSPYSSTFHNEFSYEEASASFTREFCGMLGLSSHSPLYTAVTAGGIALPRLEKVERVMAQHRGQWTSVNELPVETPLPPGFQFHSVFVCPVSKEQATDANPPMMLPCGHVIAKESLEAHSRGKPKMKCPYCPNECAPKDCKRVYI